MRGQFNRRLTGDATLASLFAYRTRPQKRHDRVLQFARHQSRRRSAKKVQQKTSKGSLSHRCATGENYSREFCSSQQPRLPAYRP